MRISEFNFSNSKLCDIEIKILNKDTDEIDKIKEKDGYIYLNDDNFFFSNEKNSFLKFNVEDKSNEMKLKEYIKQGYVNISVVKLITDDFSIGTISIYFFHLESIGSKIESKIGLYFPEDIADKLLNIIKNTSDINEFKISDDFKLFNSINNYYIYTNYEDKYIIIGRKLYILFKMTEENDSNYFEVINVSKYGENSEESKNIYKFLKELKIYKIQKINSSDKIEFLREKEYISNRIANKIKENKGYINIWEAYSNFEGKYLIEKARSVGKIVYSTSSYTEEGVSINVDKNCKAIFKNIKEGDYLEISSDVPEYIENENLTWTEYIKEKKESKSKVVKILAVNEKRNEIILDIDDRNLLNNGQIYLSIKGDQSQITRRELARDRIKNGTAAMPKLGLILNDNLEDINLIKNNKLEPIVPLTRFVKEKIFKNPPTEAQEEAIRCALNTPDIAVIQGPPGTGKTTVITAIIERLNEISDKKESSQGRILLTSFQHDAVKNLISRMRVNSVPTLKFGKKGEEDFYIEEEIGQWKNDILKKLESKNEFLKVEIEDEYISNLIYIYNNSPSDQNAIKILERIKILSKDSDLIEDISDYLENINIKEDIENSEILENLKTLRTNRDSFCDDSTQSYSEILRYLKENKLEKILEKEYNFLNENEKNIYLEDKITDEFLKELKNVKNSLFDKFIPKPKFKIEKPDKRVNEFIERYKEENTNPLSKTEEIMKEYYNDVKFSSLKNTFLKYSVAYSSTVQQSLGEELNKLKKDNKDYDVIIVDEAARLNPLDMMIALAQGSKKIILVGDHRQLPHVYNEEILDDIKTDEEFKKELSSNSIEKSLFEYLKEQAEKLEKCDNIKRTVTLDKQYRTHALLGNFINQNFYEKYNEGFSSPRLDEEFKQEFYNKPLVWIDIKEEFGKEEKIGTSWKREIEAKAIVDEIKRMINLDSENKNTFGVISFYRAQVDLIRQKLNEEGISEEKVKVGSVDAFQGMEFDVIFLSIVKSNKEAKYGFLTSESRLCVSLSRQKKLLVVVGDSDIFMHDKVRKKAENIIPSMVNLYELCKKEGVVVEKKL